MQQREDLNHKIKQVVVKLVSLTGKSTNEIMQEIENVCLRNNVIINSNERTKLNEIQQRYDFLEERYKEQMKFIYEICT